MNHATTNGLGPEIYGPDPITLEGRSGLRYWIRHPYVFTGNREVDERLSGFPVAIFQPAGRRPEETPLLVGLQGMAQPYVFNSFLVPALLDMGIAVVLFDTPLAGERSLIRSGVGEIVSEIVPLIARRVHIRSSLLQHIMEAVARDMQTVLGLAAERHGLRDSRRALFGVSLGALLTSFAFLRDGTGERLLGAIGHADLPRFARSYTPSTARWLATLPARVLAELGGWFYSQGLAAGLQFVAVLNELAHGSLAMAPANPMTYAVKAGNRRVRFLVGDIDPVVRTTDVRWCVERFPDGACYVVPGLAHGGDNFIGHARYYVQTQLGDWAW
jgi:hypothetical protein